MDVEARICTRCHEAKPSAAFPPVKRGKPKLQSWCRLCFAKANARRYQEDPQRAKTRSLENRDLRAATREAAARAMLAERNCVDCQATDDLAYDPAIARSLLLQRGDLVQSLLAQRNVRCGMCREMRQAKPSAKPKRERRHRRTTAYVPINATSDLRRCRRCGIEKPMTEFAPKHRGRPQPHSYCRDCQAKYQRDWYQRNRDAVLARMKHYRSDPRAHVRKFTYLDTRRRKWEYLMAHPCVDCGETDPVVLEFAHNRDKEASIIALMRRHASWEVIAKEIEKCDVRCANCHRRRTARERLYYRELMALRNGIEMREASAI